MLLQTNSYVVPRDRRAEHAKLLRRFRQALLRLGCESFEVYEQVGPNWNAAQSTGRFVQIMHFRDRRHQQAVQQAEQADPTAQKLIAEFCELINFPYQQQQGFFATSFYANAIGPEPVRTPVEQGRGHAAAHDRAADEQNAQPDNGASKLGHHGAPRVPQSLVQPHRRADEGMEEHEPGFGSDDAGELEPGSPNDPVIPNFRPTGAGEVEAEEEETRPLIEPLEDRSHHAGDENPMLDELP